MIFENEIADITFTLYLNCLLLSVKIVDSLMKSTFKIILRHCKSQKTLIYIDLSMYEHYMQKNVDRIFILGVIILIHQSKTSII